MLFPAGCFARTNFCFNSSTEFRCRIQTDQNDNSGIFGYINYLVEKDRKYIVDTLVNGKWTQRASLFKLLYKYNC